MAIPTRQDPARLIVQTTQISQDGTELDGELSPEVFAGIDDGHLQVEAPLIYKLRAFIVNQGLLVRGDVSSVLQCRCDRCLNSYDLPVRNESSHYWDGPLPQTVELTENLREDILILMPQKCLCKPECLGLCPGCGQNRNLANCECREESAPPSTWDQLDGLQL